MAVHSEGIKSKGMFENACFVPPFSKRLADRNDGLRLIRTLCGEPTVIRTGIKHCKLKSPSACLFSAPSLPSPLKSISAICSPSSAPSWHAAFRQTRDGRTGKKTQRRRHVGRRRRRNVCKLIRGRGRRRLCKRRRRRRQLQRVFARIGVNNARGERGRMEGHPPKNTCKFLRSSKHAIIRI